MIERPPRESPGRVPSQVGRPCFDELYDELRALARGKLGAERDGHTLEPTALVHEAWLRLCPGGPTASLDRTHFRALAARVLRNVLVDHARARGAGRRGGGARRQPLDPDRAETMVSSGGDAVSVEELERALEALAARSARQAQVVEMRFFGDLGFPEVAACLGVSVDTVKRDWRIARAWLNRALARGLLDEGGAR